MTTHCWKLLILILCMSKYYPSFENPPTPSSEVQVASEISEAARVDVVDRSIFQGLLSSKELQSRLV